MRVEEQYEDALQNLEFAIVSVYRQDPGLLDSDVDAVLEALIARYGAEHRQRAPRPMRWRRCASGGCGGRFWTSGRGVS